MFWLLRISPANEFRKHFELVLADTPELREEVYRIRHAVYCEELGFEAVNAEGREHDGYDERARHLLLRCMRTGGWAGCIRLVLPSDDRPNDPLPSEKICAATIDRSHFEGADVRRDRIAEISRLALARDFRRGRRAGHNTDTATHGQFGTPAHPRSPYLRLGLYLGAIALAHRLGIETLLFLTEPRLAAYFRKLGFPFRQVSEPVEHRGTRVLSMAHVGEPIERLPFYMRPIYRVIDREVEDSLDFGTSAAASIHRYAKGHGRIRSWWADRGGARSAAEPPHPAASGLPVLPTHV